MSWGQAPDSGVDWRAVPTAIFPFVAPQLVSTPTPLLTFVELGRVYSDLVFTVRNHDPVLQCAFYVDRSESGTVVGADRQTVYVPPASERPLELRDVMSLYWSLSAAGDPDGGFPSLSVSWQLLGRRRR